MKRFVILGCENSHAKHYLTHLKRAEFSDLECVGVYSRESEAAQKISEEFGVAVMERPDEMAGKVDGVLITARDGSFHYPYAKPYMEYATPMFIDKPITNGVDEALSLMRACRDKGIRLFGGSTIGFWSDTLRLKEYAENCGRIVGGTVTAPVKLDSEYGGFWFYSQHLVQLLLSVFGTPFEVSATRTDNRLGMTFHYEDHDVAGLYYPSQDYFCAVISRRDAFGFRLQSEEAETFGLYLSRFERLMNGGEMEESYDDLIRPVFVMDAIYRAYTTERRTRVEIIPV